MKYYLCLYRIERNVNKENFLRGKTVVVLAAIHEKGKHKSKKEEKIKRGRGRGMGNREKGSWWFPIFPLLNTKQKN